MDNYQPQNPVPQQPNYNQGSYNSNYNNGGNGWGPSGMNNVPPNNYLAFAIFTTICCCLPTGIYAIIRSTKVNTYFAMGQYELARVASEDAKKWSIIGLVIGIVVNVIGFACGLFSAMLEDM